MQAQDLPPAPRRTSQVKHHHRAEIRLTGQPGSPAYGRQRRNRRDELNNTHPNRPSQFFEAQVAEGAVEEIN
jgi:hypothetical protein